MLFHLRWVCLLWAYVQLGLRQVLFFFFLCVVHLKHHFSCKILGAIKSVVVALLGDQVGDESDLNRAFNLFYASIQVGSLFTFIVTPILRTQIAEPLNWSISLGCLTGTMFLAFLCFAGGRRWYVMKEPGASKLLRFAKLSVAAVARRVGSRCRVPTADLLRADFSEEEMGDAASLLRAVSTLFILPIYFCLLEQQGSVWIFQMMRMDRRVPFTSLEFPPEATGIYNPILTLSGVPIMAFLLPTVPPLRKVLIGLVLAVASFLMVGSRARALSLSLSLIAMRSLL